MIDLTPLEVRQKKGDFRRGFRGYDAELVDDFLDLVADRMEELVKRGMALAERVEALEDEVSEYREKEAALSDALMAAQKLREDARRHAEKESELLIREAKAEAEEARQKVMRALTREEDTLRQVRARRHQLVESFRRLLERELGELAVIEEALELKDRASSAEERRIASQAGASESEEAEEAEAEEDVEAEASSSLVGDEAVAEEDSGNGRSRPEAPVEEEGAQAEAPADLQEDWLRTLAEE